MKKQFLTGLLSTAVLLTLCVGGASAAEITNGPMIPAPAPATYTITIDGKTLQQDKNTMPEGPYLANKCVMVPLRAVAEALGDKVTWLPAEQGAKVESDTLTMTVWIGSDSYARASKVAVGMTEPVSYGAAPVIKSGRTYVPVKMFELLDCTVTVSGGAVTLKTAGTTQIPNPFVAYDTVQEAQKAVSFPVKVPELKNTTLKSISVIAKDMVQLNYADGTCYRVAAASAADQSGTVGISGDYTVYQNTRTLTVGGQTVTVKDNGDGILLAVWKDGENSYSLTFSTGVSDSALETILASVAPVR